MAPKAKPATAKAAAAKPEAKAKAKVEAKKRARTQESQEELALARLAAAEAYDDYLQNGELEEEPGSSSEERWQRGEPRRGYLPGRICVVVGSSADVEGGRQLPQVQGEEELLPEGPLDAD